MVVNSIVEEVGTTKYTKRQIEGAINDGKLYHTINHYNTLNTKLPCLHLKMV